jgi:DMSO reductase family type II enzyme heme b subunit
MFKWNDRTHDVEHHPELEYKVPADYTSYASWEDVPRKLGNFRDQIAIQFPIKKLEGGRKPHFLRGDAANPVNLWVWKSDLEEKKMPAVENVNATGPDSGLKPQDAASQIVIGKGVYSKGKPLSGVDEEEVDLGIYKVVMKRPLTTKNKSDVQFALGEFVPFSLNAWDGAWGEQGMMMSVSTWQYVILEAPIPMTVYLYTIIGILGICGVEWWIVRSLKKP